MNYVAGHPLLTPGYNEDRSLYLASKNRVSDSDATINLDGFMQELDSLLASGTTTAADQMFYTEKGDNDWWNPHSDHGPINSTYEFKKYEGWIADGANANDSKKAYIWYDQKNSILHATTSDVVIFNGRNYS